MGRPRVNQSLPEFVTAFRDRHGKTRYRFRKTGFKTVYLPGSIGSEEFWHAYLKAKNAATIEIAESRAAPGTFDDLITRFYRSGFWSGIRSDTTRNVYRGQIERFRAKYGSRRVNGMTAVMVSNLMALMSETPAAASNLKKRLSQLFDFAILLGWRKDNPTKPIKAPAQREGGYHTWTEPEIAAYEARWPIGTRQRLALALLLYTAQRRSDVVRMGPGDLTNGRLFVKQQKTRKELEIPLHPDLLKALLPMTEGQQTYLVTEYGKPFAAAGFGNWFKDACRKAGLPHCTSHGLRKAASKRMAELGLSNQLIKAITGHETDAEVSRYTKAAQQIVMADKAMAIMTEGYLSNRDNPDLANLPESVGNAW